MDFLIEHNVLSKSQIGVIPNNLTLDHIYTLHTLVDKYVNQNKTKIFACFIDLKKADDVILLSPTKEGVQQSLDLLWTVTVRPGLWQLTLRKQKL